jgi:hypothetical protein
LQGPGKRNDWQRNHHKVHSSAHQSSIRWSCFPNEVWCRTFSWTMNPSASTVHRVKHQTFWVHHRVPGHLKRLSIWRNISWLRRIGRVSSILGDRMIWPSASEKAPLEVWKPHFQRQEGTKHWSSAESLISTKCIDLWFCAPDDHSHSILWGRWITRKTPDPRPSEIEIRAAAISLISIDDFVIAEEFGQIYSLSNLWQPRIRNANVKIGNQINHKSSVSPLTLAWVRKDWRI